MSSAGALFDNFREFIQHFDFPFDANSYDEELLANHILAWLEYGDAVIESGGDFGLYMEGVAYIINRWHYDPSITDYEGPGEDSKQHRERRVQRIYLDPIEYRNLGEPLAFQQSYFKTVLFRRMIKGSGA
jgi:hypothetical protein